MLFPVIPIIILFSLTGTLGDAADSLIDDGVYPANETAGLGAGDKTATGEEGDERAAAGGVGGVGVSGGEIAFGTLGEGGVWVLCLLFEEGMVC